MARQEDWFAVALVLGVFAFVGLVAWATKRKGSKPTSEGIRLKRVGQSKIVLRNVERVKAIRDHEGRLQELEIHREVRRE